MASRLGRVLMQCRNYSSGVQGPSATAGEHGGMKTWRYMTLLVAIPGVLITWYNAKVKEEEEKEQERPEFIPYPYRYLRTKPFPWGDGEHSLFHNKHTNPMPEGYEE